MELLSIILGSGFLVSLAALFIIIGVYKNKVSTLEDDMKEIKVRITTHDQEINDTKIINATILENLKYLSQQLDKIDKKLDKEG